MPQRAPKRPNPRRGEAHYRAKLTEADVRLIIEAREAGISTRKLAEKFEVSQSAIARIVSARNWRHL
jgi:ribosome-binding protein aMBF1 (putative translation factor)